MEGWLDVLSPEFAFGWAHDGPDPVRVEVRAGGQTIAVTHAHDFRADLPPRRDGHCAFHMRLPPLHDAIGALARGGLHVAAFGCDGREYRLATACYLLPAEVIASSTMLFGDRDCASVLADLARLAAGMEAAPYRAIFASMLCDVLRGHFPRDQRPAEFNAIAAGLAEAAGRHAAAAAYRRAPLPRPPRAAEAAWSTVESEVSYACAGDLAAIRPALRCENARFIWGHSDGGLLRTDGGLVGAETPDAAATSLWVGVEGFGGSGWWRETAAGPASAATRLYSIDFEQLREIADHGGALVIDQSAEGAVAHPSAIDLLNDTLADLGLARDQALLVTQNHAFAATVAGPSARFHTATAQTYFLRGATAFARRFPDDKATCAYIETTLAHRRNAARPRKFTCLNFTPRWTRWAVALSLFERGHIPEGFFSFPGTQSAKPTESMDPTTMLPGLARRDAMVRAFEAFVASCPHIVDVDGRSGDPPDFVFPEQAARESFLHIVTETEMSAGEVLRITEKVLKPIVMLQPFIVFGNERSLELLRGMGFRTFETLFDESYDRIQSYVPRFDAAERLMLDLLAQDTAQLCDLAERAAPICIHNFLHLTFAWPALIRHGMMGRLMRTIAAMAGSRTAA